MFEGIDFLNKQMFWVFLALPLALLWYVLKHKKQTAELKISSIKGFKIGNSWLPKLKHLLFALRLCALALLILALARPQTVDVSTKTKTTRGIDIVMAIDVSASMLAKDLKPNRLEALKTVAAEFIQGRPNDRIGLVEYAGESYTKTPITSDKAIVLRSLRDIKYNTIITGGTAIGMGLATSVNRLKDSKAKSKIIILLTDGVNNSGFIDPNTASELAVEYGIKTYTIGLGTNGMALSPIALIKNGTEPKKITVVGTSKGGYIAQYVSTLANNQDLNFVFIASFRNSDIQNIPEINFCGNILTIYEKSDPFGVSSLERKKISNCEIKHFKEIELNTGMGHGFLFKALKEWIEPTIKWANGNYNVE